MIKKEKRNSTIDCYKGILIALVVIGHIKQCYVTDTGGVLTNFIWAVQMPGFMVVSGFFSARNIDSFVEVIKSWIKSAEHYLLPFLSWFILVDVGLLGRYNRNILQALSSLMNHLDGGLWFLWVVFVLSTIFAVCNYFCTTAKGTISKIVLPISSCVLFFGVLFAVGITKNVSFLGIKLILYYAVFYGFGWLIKKTESIWKPYSEKYANILLFICLVIFLAILFNFDLYHSDDNLLSVILRIIAGFSGNAVILNTISRFKSFLVNLRVNILGQYTLEIYTTHMSFIHLMTIDNISDLYTVAGFISFTVSLLLVSLFTVVAIAVLKSNPVSNYIMYGKRK